MKIIPPKRPCTDAAKDLVLGERNVDYGHPLDNFEDICTGWAVIVGTPIPVKKFPLMMEWLKICRQKQSLQATGRYHPDTQNDTCGYVFTEQIIEEEIDRRAAKISKPRVTALPATKPGNTKKKARAK